MRNIGGEESQLSKNDRKKWFLYRKSRSLISPFTIKIGGAFDYNVSPGGQEFEGTNPQKFKCSGGCPGLDVEALNWSSHSVEDGGRRFLVVVVRLCLLDGGLMDKFEDCDAVNFVKITAIFTEVNYCYGFIGADVNLWWPP